MPAANPTNKDVWRVVALACAPAIGLGIGRFAYALLLPDMKADLALSYAQAGWLNTTNAIGYLGGALVAASVIGRTGATGCGLDRETASPSRGRRASGRRIGRSKPDAAAPSQPWVRQPNCICRRCPRSVCRD